MRALRQLPGRPAALLRRRFARWALARHDPGTSTLLGQRNVYILPTPAGWFFALTLLVLLVGSINYQLNLGYLFTFALAGSALMSMHVAHANLRGLRLAAAGGEPDEWFAGRPGMLRLRLQSAQSARWGLLARLDDAEARAVDLAPEQSLELALPWRAPRRGHLAWPALRLETRYPLGLWRAWSVWRPPLGLWVYPAPSEPGLPLPLTGAREGEGARQRRAEGDEPDELRDWRSGDPLRRVVWRKSREQRWVVRSAGTQPALELLCLDWHALPPAMPAEQRLEQLCAWVLQARRAGLAWELRLPERSRTGAATPEHARECLRMLAQWGRPDAGSDDASDATFDAAAGA